MYNINYSSMAPEIAVCIAACAILLLGVCIQNKTIHIVNYYIALLTVLSVCFFSFCNYDSIMQQLFYKQYIIDKFSNVLKCIVGFLGFFVLVYSKHFYVKFKIKSEFFVFMLFSMLGMMLVISANNFLITYIGLELLALPIYTLCAVAAPSKKSTEAAIKYFVLGAIASGLLLYGMSLIYGTVRTLQIPDFINYVVAHKELPVAFLFGMAFITAGIAFKFGAVPFHLWVPDVYQGAPLGVVVFLSSLPKLAAFALAYRILSKEVLQASHLYANLTLLLAISSIIIGNLLALVQTSITRMLGYSAIANIGFILLGISVGSVSGYKAGLFYALIYVFMIIGVFGIIITLSSKEYVAEKIEHFRGLCQSQPVVAAMILLYFLALVGVPPFPGFMAKWIVLSMAMAQGYKISVLIAVIMSVIGAYYYLRVIRAMYFETPILCLEPVRPGMLSFMFINLFLVLLIGFFPDLLMKIISLGVF